MEKIVLSEKEKRDIRDYLESGKPLPEKYRFLLFAEKKVELVFFWQRQIFDWARYQIIFLISIFSFSKLKQFFP